MKKISFYILAIIGALFLIAAILVLAQMFFGLNLPRFDNQTLALGRGGAMPESLAMKSMVAPSAVADAGVVAIPRKITKTGNLDILVTEAEVALAQIKDLADRLGGYIGNSNIYESAPGVKSGQVVVRVPAEKFESALLAIKKLALRVESESVNADDVTEQYIDVTARLRVLQAQEAQYLAILKQAQKVDDILNVTNRLTEVRGQIESLQSQLKYLNSQVDLSTITVGLTAEKDVTILGLHWQPLAVIKQAIYNLLNGLVSYVNTLISVAIYLPVILVWLATIVIVGAFVYGMARELLKRFRSRQPAKVVKSRPKK